MSNSPKIFFRQFKKQGNIGIIKTLGLVLGMLSALFILEYVVYERSYDKDHGEDVYRLAYSRYGKEGLMWRTINFFVPAGPYMEGKYHEVEQSATLWPAHEITLSYTDTFGNIIVENIEKSYYATNSLFSVLRYPIVAGNKKCIDEPNLVAISERAAQKFFGSTDPIGKTLKLNHRDVFTVSAVFKNLPPNSHLKSDFFFSFQTLVARRPDLATSWLGDGAHVYLKLKQTTDYIEFQKKFATAMIEDNYADQQKKQNQRDEIFLQPVRSIHLYSNLEYELEPPGNGKAVTLLFVFSIFFLVIAWVNYINLESAKSIERAKEIGLKRATGSSRKLLIKQFITEALLLNLFCYLLTIVLYLVIDPFYRNAAGIPHEVKVLGVSFWAVFTFSVILGAILSSLYPAFVLSSFKPVEVLRGRFASSKHSYFLRKALVTFQFTLSIILIAGTIITYKQVDYLNKKDFGIAYQSKLIVKAPKRSAYGGAFQSKMDMLLDKIAQEPGVSDYTFCSDIPGKEIYGFWGGYPKGETENEHNWFFGIHADYRFASCFGTQLLAGRHFRKDDDPGSRMLILNESALKRFDINNAESAINKIIVGYDKHEWQIIGVYKDFHYSSAKASPVAVCVTNQVNQRRYLAIKLAANSKFGNEKLVSSVKKAFQETFPDQPFDYFYLQDLVSANLKPDKTFVSVFGLFSILALIIALTGIVGLLQIFILQHLKEYGMRKVLGAEVHHIFVSLAQQFTIQLAIAIIVGVTLSAYGFGRWISQNYVSHIEMKTGFFIVPVCIVTLALTAVLIWAAVKTYRTNAIEVINYE